MSVNQYKNGKLNLVAGASNAPDVLDSYEEIQANTAPDKVAGALGVKELLGGLRFGKDGDGNYGYYGADGSLIPFSSGNKVIEIVPLVPAMTSNTTPEGEAFSSSNWDSTYSAWKAFNGSNNGDSDAWHNSAAANSSDYLGYKFTIPTLVKKFSIRNRNVSGSVSAVKIVQLQGSNDNNQWVNIGEKFINQDGGNVLTTFEVVNKNYYTYYRVYMTESYDTINRCIGQLQFYGYQMEALVPLMTSNITPSGEVFGSTTFSSDYALYKAFDGINGTEAIPQTDIKNGGYIGYKFKEPTCVKWFYNSLASNSTSANFNVQASNDNTNWTNLYSYSLNSNGSISMKLDNDNSYLYYRISFSPTATSEWVRISTIQFYTGPKGADGGIPVDSLLFTSTQHSVGTVYTHNSEDTDIYLVCGAIGSTGWEPYIAFDSTTTMDTTSMVEISSTMNNYSDAGTVFMNLIKVYKARIRRGETIANNKFYYRGCFSVFKSTMGASAAGGGKGYYAVMSSSIVHGSFAYTTGDTNNEEYFQLLYSETQPSGNTTGQTNTITIKKDCTVKTVFMMTGGTGSTDSFVVDINGTRTTYTKQYGVLYEKILNLKAGDTISLIGNGSSASYSGATLLVSLEGVTGASAGELTFRLGSQSGSGSVGGNGHLYLSDVTNFTKMKVLMTDGDGMYYVKDNPFTNTGSATGAISPSTTEQIIDISSYNSLGLFKSSKGTGTTYATITLY